MLLELHKDDSSLVVSHLRRVSDLVDDWRKLHPELEFRGKQLGHAIKLDFYKEHDECFFALSFDWDKFSTIRDEQFKELAFFKTLRDMVKDYGHLVDTIPTPAREARASADFSTVKYTHNHRFDKPIFNDPVVYPTITVHKSRPRTREIEKYINDYPINPF